MASTINASTSSGLVNTADTSGILQLQTASVTAVTIDGSQSVGIGTASPAYKLDVSSTSTTVAHFYNSAGRGLCVVDGTSDSSFRVSRAGTMIGWFQSDSSGTEVNMGTSGAYPLAFYTNNAERMRIDSTGNVLVNSTTLFDPNNYSASGSKFIQVKNTTTDRGSFVNIIGGGGGANGYWAGGINFAVSGQAYATASIFSYTGTTATSGILGFTTSSDTTGVPTERMRIESNGRVNINATSNLDASRLFLQMSSGDNAMSIRSYDSSTNVMQLQFYTASNSRIGYIQTIGGTSTVFSTASDYRLKENVAPMSGALAKVAQLKPVTYKWKSTGENSQGFIAHELAEVVPDCVTGEKDAVRLEDIKDEEGNVIGQEEKPVYQGIDTSFLVATLTAAIQEQQALITDLTTRLAALEGAK